MIEDILNLVLGNQIETAIIIAVGLLLGALISSFYWKGQVYKREAQIRDLDTTVEGKDTDLNEMRARAQELLNEKEKEIEGLNTQLKNTKTTLGEREKEIENLKTQLEDTIRDMTLQIDEKDESIELLKKEIAELEEKNRNSVIRAEGAEVRVSELEKALEGKTEEAANFDKMNQDSVARAEGAEARVMELEQALEEKTEESANFDKMNQESVARAEGAEARVEELENSLEEKEQEATALNARIHMMQDDFTHIAGIGPKVSSVLRWAGLNTFAKLAAADVDKIREILEAENPSLLRLTDPATWPDQARLAAEEDWEGLSALQESIKSSRRT